MWISATLNQACFRLLSLRLQIKMLSTLRHCLQTVMAICKSVLSAMTENDVKYEMMYVQCSSHISSSSLTSSSWAFLEICQDQEQWCFHHLNFSSSAEWESHQLNDEQHKSTHSTLWQCRLRSPRVEIECWLTCQWWFLWQCWEINEINDLTHCLSHKMLIDSCDSLTINTSISRWSSCSASNNSIKSACRFCTVVWMIVMKIVSTIS